MGTGPLRVDDFVSGLQRALPKAGAVVDAHVEEHGEVLVHVLVADLRRLLLEEFHDGDADLVRRGLVLLDRALATGDAAVVNAVAVSFVEDIGWWDPAVQPFVDEWPAALRAELERQRSWRP